VLFIRLIFNSKVLQSLLIKKELNTCLIQKHKAFDLNKTILANDYPKKESTNSILLKT